MQRKVAWRESNAIADWFAGKSEAELDVIEVGHRALYSDSVKKRDRKVPGKLQEVPVRLRVPNSRDKAMARLDALSWAKKLMSEAGYKAPERLTIEDAQAVLGAVYFDELDTKCLIARCTREHEPPHEQYMLYEMLDTLHEHASLMDLWDRLCFYQELEDVRVSELTEEQLLAVVAAIDGVRNLSPLVVIAGSARDSCIVTMACRLQSYLKRSSCSPSTAT
jgi:hypothetical protein